MAKTKDYNLIDWSKLFRYSEESPTGIVSIKSSKPVGHVTEKGYRVDAAGSRWYTHRIVYSLHFGEIDKNLVIDHIDGNRYNNKISNLRLVTIEINNKNKGKYKQSLKSGVTWLETDGYLFAQARLGTKNRQCYLFSVTKLGIMEAWKQACIKRMQLLEEATEYGERHKQKE